MRREPLYHPILRFPILALIASIVLLEFPGSRDLIETPYSGIETINLVVQNVGEESPNTDKDIRQNDEIRAVAGERVRNYHHLRYLVKRNTGFAPQEYELSRGDETITVTVEYVPIPSSLVHRRFGRLLVGFTFLLTGLLVLLRRCDSIGILFSLNCTILCYFLADRPVLPTPSLQITGELFDDAMMVFFPAVFLHFFRVFPGRVRVMDRRAHVRRVLVIYGFPSLLFLVGSVFIIRNFFFVRTSSGVLTMMLAASTFYTAWYLLASLIVFVRNYRFSSVAQKQKLRIAIAGTVVGIVPFLTVIVWRQIMPGSYTLWEFLSSLGLVFVSISFAYAILKHGAIELNIVVRKSIVYAFLTGLIIAAYYGLVRLLGDYLTSEFNLRPAYFSVIAVLVLAVIFAPAREIVQGVVDRLFFRGDYDYKEEVVEFNRQLSRKLKKREILGYFSERMETLLKSSFFAFYSRDDSDGELKLDASDENGSSLPPTFPKDSLLGRYLSRYRKALMVEYLDSSWGRRYLDATSTEFLEASKAAVCLPIGSGESLSGLIILGSKRSGLLYTRTDSELLETFSEHLGLVLENAELHEATMEKERLKNEVMLAREIQLSLLPKEPPRHTSVELLGQMVSSVEVGGDYFDYFELGRERIGVAIGDVSGKGVPAAMLMSSLQAVFKNLALRDGMNPGDVISEVNKYLCSSGKPEQFATFFYGILDLKDSTFTFCNAGHCPALLVKPDYVDRLGEGGMILGIEPAKRYAEGRVRVEPGNMICLYTDGVTEQTNAGGDQYGEKGLIEFLRANRNLPLSDLQESLFASVLAFGDGRQDDDITNVITRYKIA
ncbi:MAG: SpoIIE family protein phosphatase [Candidatus Latescibacterota bacterium]|nr:MAG: SpoIIE family protein phosphatase [Candidatus Latescibacterota bacterium]